MCHWFRKWEYYPLLPDKLRLLFLLRLDRLQFWKARATFRPPRIHRGSQIVSMNAPALLPLLVDYERLGPSTSYGAARARARREQKLFGKVKIIERRTTRLRNADSKKTGNRAAVMRPVGHKNVETAMQNQHREARDRAHCTRSGHSSRETGVGGLHYGTLKQQLR